MRRNPSLPVPMWKASSRSMYDMERPRGANAEYFSICNWNLQMLKYSAFAPLGRSMSYMLREEAFHMGTGNDGLRRIVEAGVIPAWLIQKYLNKWISSAYDLFGTDNSSSAHWAYVWGIKGRYDEPKNEKEANLDDLNDYNRNLYRDEVAGLIA